MFRLLRHDWTSIEALTLLYILFTTVLTVAYWPTLDAPLAMLGLRAGVVVYILASRALAARLGTRLGMAVRTLPLLMCLAVWYPETYQFCRHFPYLDHVFARADWQLFGMQPSIEFARKYTSSLWHELMCMGYYSYYYLMAAVLIFFLTARTPRYQWASFVFLSSFFLFYVIYEFLPVAGPQYYYAALTPEAAAVPVFPALGHYFATHATCLPLAGDGLFSHLVQAAQEAGEHPTAAFPSSHVGMSTVAMLLALRSKSRTLVLTLSPFYLLLVLSTVYIRAHYVVDSVAGLLCGVAFFYLFSSLYPAAARRLRLLP